MIKVASALPAILRKRSLAPADALMTGALCRFRRFGTDVVVPGDLFGGAREMYARGVYFAPPNFRLRAGDTVIDLGANQGLFTVLAARIAAKVVAVEAQSRFLEAIRRHLALNPGTAEVALVLGLVGAESGVFADPGALRSSTHYEAAPPVFTMERLFEEHGVRRVDFLKIDIEGSEFSLLGRDVDWLRSVGKVAMEVHLEFGDPSALVDTFARAGFRTELRDNDLHPVSVLTGVGGYLYAWRP